MGPAWIRFRAALPLADVVVVIDHGRARVTRGSLRPGLLSELNDLARTLGIDLACIRAQTPPLGYRLIFVGVPEEYQQRFRNLWGAYWR
jgi:hypothetical protein